MKTKGIHHITAIVGDPQENVDFYAGFLGMRLVKKTINFDDPGTYHLYFGDDNGSPGTIMTFFPWPGAHKGASGGGQVGRTDFAIPPRTMDFWKKRFEKFNVSYEETTRFGQTYLQFEDPHGLQLSLVEQESGRNSQWPFNGISEIEAIKGFSGATLLSINFKETATLLEETMGFERVGEQDGYIRFSSNAAIGGTIDLYADNVGTGRLGAGTVHHIAYRAKDDDEQVEWQKHVANAGYQVTPVQDRQYFNAIYFRERGQLLFEIATDPPGFAHDESYKTMGEQLKLPEWYESDRDKIEANLHPAEVRTINHL
ncbi:ring-cleaving dioxygenase [Geomicrobium sp. JCM 19055]|uniref:ring-cleaving dioxygenase n=1 Tax=Geomicrobium sp. JCM 19055 TaxID=1460649 RepID=UPI00045EDA37|nr:ring-cleaving dioxygenase [Geomicrobium sp. JCM 19055]GAJ98015.1 glyoxalase family protein [Geomicrobium sp. JCM 19055]